MNIERPIASNRTWKQSINAGFVIPSQKVATIYPVIMIVWIYYTYSKTRLIENVFTLTLALTLTLSLTLTLPLKRNNVFGLTKWHYFSIKCTDTWLFCIKFSKLASEKKCWIHPRPMLLAVPSCSSSI